MPKIHIEKPTVHIHIGAPAPSGIPSLGLARQAGASHNEQALICRALLKRGHAVESLHLSKAFRRSGVRP